MSVGLRLQNFLNGTVGSAITTSNPPTAGTDTHADAVSFTGTGSGTVFASSAFGGVNVMRTVQTSTTSSDQYFRYTPYATIIGAVRGAFLCETAVPASGTQQVYRSFANNSARWASVNITAASKLVLAISSADTIVYTSPTLVHDKAYGWQLSFSNFGSGVTVINFQVYDLTSNDFATPIDAGFTTTSGATGAGTAVVDSRWGRSAGSTVNTMQFGGFGFDDTTSTFLGPIFTDTASIAMTGLGTMNADGSSVPATSLQMTGAGSMSATGTDTIRPAIAMAGAGSMGVAATVMTTPDPAKVAVIGDSLISQATFGPTDIPTAFTAVGWSGPNIYIDGLGSRAIWEPHGASPYTRAAIDTMRASGFEPLTIVVDEGTNNTGFLVPDIMADYRTEMAYVGPGRVINYIGIGYQDQTECQVQYNPAAALGSRWSELNTVGGRPNAALLNIIEQGINPATEPVIVYHNWNDYAPMRAAGTTPWDLTDTSSPNGTSRHNTRTGYQTYRNPFMAQASLDTGTVSATIAMAGVGTMTATGSIQHPAAIAMSGAGVMTNTGAGTVSGTIAMSGSGSMGVTGQGTISPSVAMAGSNSMTVAGSVAHPSTVAMSGSGSMTTTGADTLPTVISMAGTGIMTASSGGQQSSTLAIAGAGSMGLAGSVTHQASIAMSGAGLMSISSSTIHQTALAFVGAGTLTVAAHDEAMAQLAMLGIGTMTVSSSAPVPVTTPPERIAIAPADDRVAVYPAPA